MCRPEDAEMLYPSLWQRLIHLFGDDSTNNFSPRDYRPRRLLEGNAGASFMALIAGAVMWLYPLYVRVRMYVCMYVGCRCVVVV